MSTRARARSLKDQLDAVVDTDWSEVGWWGLAWGVAALEGMSDPHVTEAHRTLYHRANGGPDSDTFMGRPRSREDEPATRWAASVAFRAVDALASLDGRLPGQPLRVHLTWRRRWLRIEPLPETSTRAVVFTVRGRHYRTVLEETPSAQEPSPGVVDRLAENLAALVRGGPRPAAFTPVTGDGPVAAAAAVSLDVLHHDRARHTHRQCWAGAGGPWLGVVRTPDLSLVTTCHLVVDGMGHAWLTDRILPGGSRSHRSDAPPPLGEPAGATYPRTAVAWQFVPEGTGRFSEQAYATGLALEAFYGRGGHAPPGPRFTPSFTVPVAPGPAEDPERRRRRVLHGLLSVRLHGRGVESYEDFRARLNPWLQQERAGSGALTRIAAAVARSPLPDRLKILSLSNHHGPHLRIPSVEALSGRARLSSLRFPEDPPAPPLVAASLPTLLPTGNDPRGGVVLTLLHHERGTTVSVFGTGRAGTPEGAESFLHLWLETLAGVQP